MTELSTIVEVQDRVSEPIMKITAMLYKSVYAFERLKNVSESRHGRNLWICSRGVAIKERFD